MSAPEKTDAPDAVIREFTKAQEFGMPTDAGLRKIVQPCDKYPELVNRPVVSKSGLTVPPLPPTPTFVALGSVAADLRDSVGEGEKQHEGYEQQQHEDAHMHFVGFHPVDIAWDEITIKGILGEEPTEVSRKFTAPPPIPDDREYTCSVCGAPRPPVHDKAAFVPKHGWLCPHCAKEKGYVGIERPKEEADPTGRKPGEAGAKLDKGKVRLGLVLGGFANALMEVGKVGTLGAAKYSDNGWMAVPNARERYTDAELRHCLKRLAGEIYDPEWGLLHLAHNAWNSLAILELELRKAKDNGPKET